jgi:hypothetical protein
VDRFDFTLHAKTRCHFLFHKHVLVVFLFYCFQHKKNKRNKKIGEKMQNFIFSFDSFSNIVCVFA